MADPIRPKDLSAGLPNSDAALIFDNGTQVLRASPTDLLNAASALASQSDMQSGTDNAKRVTPLRVSQAIDTRIVDGLGDSASIAPSQRSVATSLAGKADDALNNVPAFRRETPAGTELQSYPAPLSGFPYDDGAVDIHLIGSVANPFVHVVAENAFLQTAGELTLIGENHVGGVQARLAGLQIRGKARDGKNASNQNYFPLLTMVSFTVNMGGTDTSMANSAGQGFSQGMLSVLFYGSTNIRNITCCEANTQCNAGSSVALKTTFQAVGTPDDQVRGTQGDIRYYASNQVGAIAVKNIFASGALCGANPSDGGTTWGAALDNPILKTGLDFNGVSFLGNAYQSPGHSMDGSGTAYHKNVRVQSAGGSVVIGDTSVASSTVLGFSSSGIGSPPYDAGIVGAGGDGTQGHGLLSLDCSVVRPARDNFTAHGSADFRFTQYFAVTPTIGTSDATQKLVLGSLASPEYSAVLDAIGSVDFEAYKFLDAVAEKGDGARLHAGIVSQKLHAAGLAHGVDLFGWGVLCRDPAMEEVSEVYEDERVKRVISQIEEDEFTVKDGKVVKRIVLRDVEHDAFEMLPVVDESGAEKIIPARAARTETDPSTGEVINLPATPAKPLMYSVPVTEKYTATRTISRRKKDADGKDAWIWGVRYTEFLVLRQAWMERELRKVAKA